MRSPREQPATTVPGTARPSPGPRPAVWVQPGADPGLESAVTQGGGRLVTDHTAAEALVWVDKDVAALARSLHPGIRWVQLPDAGIESWLGAGVLDRGPVFTSARGCYGPQVAEHALALLLAATRRIPDCAALTGWPATRPTGRSLRGARIVVVGAGAIGSHLVEMLVPLGACVHAVSRSGRGVTGAVASHRADDLPDLLPTADHVVLAAPSTPATRGLVSTPQLEAMRRDAWLVNVGRGDLLDTGALVDVLQAGGIGGAALDVTDPEPLPDGHPLWLLPNVILTPHVANPPAMKAQALARRVRDNTGRFVAGEALLGLIDEEAGY